MALMVTKMEYEDDHCDANDDEDDHEDDHDVRTCIVRTTSVTHKGVLLPAQCNAGATREDLRASSKGYLPIKNKCDMQVSSWRHISCHTDKNRYYT